MGYYRIKIFKENYLVCKSRAGISEKYDSAKYTNNGCKIVEVLFLDYQGEYYKATGDSTSGPWQKNSKNSVKGVLRGVYKSVYSSHHAENKYYHCQGEKNIVLKLLTFAF